MKCLKSNFIDNFHKGPINNTFTLIYLMAWHQTGNNTLSKPMVMYFTDGLTEICVTWPKGQ